MDLERVLQRRRMVRRYADRPVDAAARDRLLAAGRRAPTAGFSQGVSFLVLESGADRDAFWRATSGPEEGSNRWLDGMRTAPLLVTVWTSEQAYRERYAEPDKGWSPTAGRWSAPYWWVDAGMAVMAILLGSVDAGLGACFFGVPPDRQQAVREVFAVPAEQASVGVVSVGHPASGGSPGSSGRSRRPDADVVHHGRWDSGH